MMKLNMLLLYFCFIVALERNGIWLKVPLWLSVGKKIIINAYVWQPGAICQINYLRFIQDALFCWLNFPISMSFIRKWKLKKEMFTNYFNQNDTKIYNWQENNVQDIFQNSVMEQLLMGLSQTAPHMWMWSTLLRFFNNNNLVFCLKSGVRTLNALYHMILSVEHQFLYCCWVNHTFHSILYNLFSWVFLALVLLDSFFQ